MEENGREYRKNCFCNSEKLKETATLIYSTKLLRLILKIVMPP